MPPSNQNEIKELITQMRQEHSESLEAKLTEIMKLRTELKEILKENSNIKLYMANNPPSNDGQKSLLLEGPSVSKNA